MTDTLTHFRLALAALVALCGVLLGPAAPALALAHRSADTIIIAPGERIADDVAVAGRLVRIDGQVDGDVYAFAQNIIVTGTIGGDLIAAGQQVVIDGQVLGDVRAVGATVQVNGEVGRNATLAGSLVNLGPGGRIAGSWMAAGGTSTVYGDIGGSLAEAGTTAMLQGRVGRSAEVAAQTISFGPNARIGGNLQYYSEAPQLIPPGVVAGQVSYQPMPQRSERVDRAPVVAGTAQRAVGRVFGFFRVAWLVGSAIVGIIFLQLFRRFFAGYLDTLEQRPLPSFLIGLVALIVTLPVAVLVGITVIGLPLSAVLVGSYFGGLFFGWLLLAAALGTILVGWFRRGQPGQLRHLWLTYLLGLVVLYLATLIPFLGALVSFLGASFGLGTLLLTLYRTWTGAGPDSPVIPITPVAPPLTPGVPAAV